MLITLKFLCDPSLTVRTYIELLSIPLRLAFHYGTHESKREYVHVISMATILCVKMYWMKGNIIAFGTRV